MTDEQQLIHEFEYKEKVHGFLSQIDLNEYEKQQFFKIGAWLADHFGAYCQLKNMQK